MNELIMHMSNSAMFIVKIKFNQLCAHRTLYRSDHFFSSISPLPSQLMPPSSSFVLSTLAVLCCFCYSSLLPVALAGPDPGCSSDTFQCEDSSVVFRTGPNCLFFCPTLANEASVTSDQGSLIFETALSSANPSRPTSVYFKRGAQSMDFVATVQVGGDEH